MGRLEDVFFHLLGKCALQGDPLWERGSWQDRTHPSPLLAPPERPLSPSLCMGSAKGCLSVHSAQLFLVPGAPGSGCSEPSFLGGPVPPGEGHPPHRSVSAETVGRGAREAGGEGVRGLSELPRSVPEQCSAAARDWIRVPARRRVLPTGLHASGDSGAEFRVNGPEQRPGCLGASSVYGQRMEPGGLWTLRCSRESHYFP